MKNTEVFDLLLKNLFIGTYKDILEILKPLSTEQRKQLNKSFSLVYKVIDSANNDLTSGGYNPNKKEKKLISLKTFYELLKANDLNTFTEMIWKDYDSNNTISYTKGYRPFMTRLRIIKVGLSDKKDIKNLFKFDNYMSESGDHEMNQLLNMGKALLDRNEDWNKAFFLEFFDKYDKWIDHFFTGIAELLMYIRTEKPEWRDELYKYIGKTMYSSGFYIYNENNSEYLCYKTFDNEMILAGLDFSDFPKSSNLSDIYIAQEHNLEQLFKNIKNETFTESKAGQGVSRFDLINLVFKKLQLPLHNVHNGYWLKLLEKLNLSEEEINYQQENILNLLNASNAKSTEFALQRTKILLTEKKINISEIFEPLTYLFNNQNKSIAELSWSIVKKEIKKDSNLINDLIDTVIDSLTTPHKTFRKDLIKWLKDFSKILNQEQKEKLLEMKDFFVINEKEEIEKIIGLESSNNDTPIQIEDLNKTSDMDSIIEKLQIKIKELPYHRQYKNWYEYLNSSKSDLEPIKPSLLDYHQEKSFDLCSTPEELIDLILSIRNHRSDIAVSLRVWEKIIGSILIHKDFGSDEKTKKLLDPINKLIDKFNVFVNIYKESYPKEFTHDLGFACLLVYGWQNKGELFPSKRRSPMEAAFQYCNLGNKLRLLDLLEVLKGNYKTLLSTPTHEAGWISPNVFVKRLNSLDDLQINDLINALYRIPDIKEEKELIWSQIKNKVKTFKDKFQWALNIALGDEDLYLNSKNNFIEFFKNNKFSVEIASNSYQALEKMPDDYDDFKLFYASLRCRFGLSDFKDIVPELSTKEFTDNYLVRQSYNSKKFTELTDVEKASHLSLFLHPEPLYPDKNRHYYFEIYQRSDDDPLSYQFRYHDSNFYHLHPYCYMGILKDKNYSLVYPNIGIRFYEAAVMRISKNSYRTDGIVESLNIAHLPYIDILSRLDNIISPYKYPEQREKLVDILNIAINDGRITPNALAESFCNKIKLNDSIQYLDYILESLSNYSYSRKLIVQFILEYSIPNSLNDLSPKNLSLLLERYYKLLTDNNFKIRNQTFIDFITNLSLSKKGVLKEKSLLILKLKTNIKDDFMKEIIKNIIEELF